jgi:hypothetical protein
MDVNYPSQNKMVILKNIFLWNWNKNGGAMEEGEEVIVANMAI